MRRRLIAKGNVHRNDYLRALVTDTLPGDVPIVISNDGFYLNMRAAPLPNAEQWELVERLLSPDRPYTIPYRYNILRTRGTARKLSLMHPAGQINVVDLYREYEDLICYFCRKSPASLRSPQKVGSLFFVRGTNSDRNKLKGSTIDTVEIENSVSNPATYFTYSGVDRAFKFFASGDYLRLEKRYGVMYFTDISKCFGSIYTHTLFWATADVSTAKDNRNARVFSNRFDKLMQSVNYNETNGICVGAEVSRIFAELILSEIDRRIVVHLEMSDRPLRFRTHYEFRRYVDDYYVFSQNDEVAERVLAAISLHLSEFNLHLSEQKTVKVPRPFITTKSRMVRDASETLDGFFLKFISSARAPASEGGLVYSFPKRIRRPQALMRSLLDGIKASCFDNQSGYEEISNYVIGALGSRINAIIDGYEFARKHSADGMERVVEEDDYISSIVLLLDLVYFFYNVHPTVPSSLRVAQTAILSFGFVKDNFPDRAPFLTELIVRWTFQFIKELEGETAHQDSQCIPLEAINVLLVLGEVGRGEVLARNAITEFCGEVRSLGYFEIISYLYCLGDGPELANLRDELFQQAKALVSGKDKTRVQAEAAHLALDLLACPHIEAIQRADLFNDLREDVGLPRVSILKAEAAVAAFEAAPWFVNWKAPNLLTLIRKKELSAVY